MPGRRLSTTSIEETQQTRKLTCNHRRAINHVAVGNQGQGELVQASPDHAMAIQGHGRRCGALFLPSTRPTGGGAGWRGRAVPAQLAALPFPTAPQGISMGKGQGRESSSLGFRFFRRWARRRGGGGSSTMRPKLRGQKSRRKAITKK